ncbi:MAG: SagB/ThcOx family dehydrogenase [Bacillota bacterium]
MDRIKQNRELMKSNFEEIDRLGILSDQEKELPQPPLQKPFDDSGEIIDLPQVDASIIRKKDILSCLKDRRSRRKYSDEELSINELSFLLWATQGVDKVTKNNYSTLRPVPSAGARHPFETYLVINRVEGIKSGVYRYLALSHQLLHMYSDEQIEEKATAATLDQPFAGNCAVLFIWSCVPYRGEWRYHMTAHKPMLLDAGHLCQNLYIACEAIECGTCAIAAYDQKLMDELIKVDGEEEFTVYLSPVGKFNAN